MVQYFYPSEEMIEFQCNLIVLIEAVGVEIIPLYWIKFPPTVMRTR